MPSGSSSSIASHSPAQWTPVDILKPPMKSVSRLHPLSGAELISPYLSEVKITNQDYSKSLFHDGDDVFIFLDPPYWKATESKLYGTRGALHTSFDHLQFAENMKKCQHKWLITYDDSPMIRDLFDFADISKWTLQYGMNNYLKETAAKGNELFIKNY